MENIFNISNDVLSVESFEYWLKEYFNGLNYEEHLSRSEIDRILKNAINKLFSDFNFKEEKLSKILDYYSINISHAPNIGFIVSETETNHKVIIGSNTYYLIEDDENGTAIHLNGPKFKYYIKGDIIDIKLVLKSNKNNRLPKNIDLFVIDYFDGKIDDVYNHWSRKISNSVQLEYYIYYVLLDRIYTDVSLLIDIHMNNKDTMKKIKKILYYAEIPNGIDIDYMTLNYDSFKFYCDFKNKLKESIKLLKIIPFKNLKINSIESIIKLKEYVNA